LIRCRRRRRPIIFLTAIVSQEETNGHEAHIGGLSYLAKPVELNELTRVIGEHLKKQSGIP
jgi:DNA-binding response OmpR family regulator